MAASNDDGLLYMPVFMAHEFGHAAGLWHSPGTSDAMSGPPNEMANLSSNDTNAMRALYDNHSSP